MKQHNTICFTKLNAIKIYEPERNSDSKTNQPNGSHAYEM